jgi:hypothetical protein
MCAERPGRHMVEGPGWSACQSLSSGLRIGPDAGCHGIRIGALASRVQRGMSLLSSRPARPERTGSPGLVRPSRLPQFRFRELQGMALPREGRNRRQFLLTVALERGAKPFRQFPDSHAMMIARWGRRFRLALSPAKQGPWPSTRAMGLSYEFMPIDPSAVISPTAVVSPHAIIGPAVRIGEFCIVEPDTVIGAHCVLDAYVYVKRWTTLGECNEAGAVPASIHESAARPQYPTCREARYRRAERREGCRESARARAPWSRTVRKSRIPVNHRSAGSALPG